MHCKAGVKREGRGRLLRWFTPIGIDLLWTYLEFQSPGSRFAAAMCNSLLLAGTSEMRQLLFRDCCKATAFTESDNYEPRALDMRYMLASKKRAHSIVTCDGRPITGCATTTPRLCASTSRASLEHPLLVDFWLHSPSSLQVIDLSMAYSR